MSLSKAEIKDPVCGMGVTEQSPYSSMYGRERFFFCSGKCKSRFDADPARFSEGAGALAQRAPAALPAGTIYTCPTIVPGVFPTSFISMGRVGVYYEAAAVIISLTLLGQILELKARSQTSAAIKSLLKLAPKTARRIRSRPRYTQKLHPCQVR